jgi:hypothetical protein
MLKKTPMKTKLIIAVLSCIIFTGCSTQERCAAYSSGHMNARFLDDNMESDKATSRMMIYNASISLEARNPDTVALKVAAIAKKYKGYVLTSSNTYTSIRVLSASLKEALDEIETFGKVKSKNISGTDVTDEFTDYTIRLENAERSRKRYLELLQKAVTVEETLKVEKELERLNGDIDLLKGKMNRINHLVDYSTIVVYHKEKVKPGIIGYVFVGLYKAAKWLFVRN